MNPLKLILAASLAAVAAIASIQATDAPQAPATPTSQAPAACHTSAHSADQRTGLVLGSPKALSNLPAGALVGSKCDAQESCCKTKVDPAKKSCCK